jgi:RHS repeat-associated protein
MTYSFASAPYGESYDSAGSSSSDLNFTGQFQDTIIGLYDFQHREFDPVQGRWISPDPAGLQAADSSDPQTWNRYAYVRNSPLNLTDPSGLEPPNWHPGCNLWFGPDCPGYTMDGQQVTRAEAQAALGAGSAMTCPDNNCALLNRTLSGQFGGQFSLAAGANGWVWISQSNGTELSSAAAAEVGLPSFAQGPAANNGSWGWNFTKSFFTGFSLKAVYRSFADPDGCDNLMATTIAGDMNPFPTDEIGPGDVADLAPKAAGALGVINGLQVPALELSAGLEFAATWAAPVYVGGHALYASGTAWLSLCRDCPDRLGSLCRSYYFH